MKLRKELLLLLLGLIVYPHPSNAAKLPTAEEVQGIMVVCGGGRQQNFSGDVQAKIEIWKRRANASGAANISDLSALFSTLPTGEQVNAALYKQYTSCVTELITKFISQQEQKPKHRLSIQTNGFFIDNRLIPPVRASSSKIDFEINGEYIESMQLSEHFPGITATLEEGDHTFTYKVDIRTQSIRIRASCSVPVNLKRSVTLSPLIVFAPYDESRGMIKSCSLNPI